MLSTADHGENLAPKGRVEIRQRFQRKCIKEKKKRQKDGRKKEKELAGQQTWLLVFAQQVDIPMAGFDQRELAHPDIGRKEIKSNDFLFSLFRRSSILVVVVVVVVKNN